jgi:hypothetical protein
MKILVVGDNCFLRLKMRGECDDFSTMHKCYFNTAKIGEVNMTIK